MTEQREWARGRSWWQTATKPQGGFVLVREKALLTAWAALSDGQISLRDLRVWLASFEAVERRLCARSRRTPKFKNEELHRLVGGVGGQHIRSSLRNLQRAGLGVWTEERIQLLGGRSSSMKSEGRLVPIPRPLLRHLASGRGRAYIGTALAHLLRCLYYRAGDCISGGYCKCSWVADTFDVGIRAVKAARGELARFGFIKILDADQHRLNRYGCPVVVSLDRQSPTQSAPPRKQSTTKSAPPSKHKNLSLRRSEHQKPGVARFPTGVCDRTKRERGATMRDVTFRDLESPMRLVTLFLDAERRGYVRRCDADKLAFFAIAEHAKRVATRNAPGLFAALIRRQRYSFISTNDEEHARRNLVALRDADCLIPAQKPSLQRQSTAQCRVTSPPG